MISYWVGYDWEFNFQSKPNGKIKYKVKVVKRQ